MWMKVFKGRLTGKIHGTSLARLPVAVILGFLTWFA
jgi:hypothetical protein